MNERITAQDIGLALQAGGLHPYVKVSLTLCIEPASIGSFSKRLPQWLAGIEQAVDQLGQACDLVLREAAQDDLAEVSNQLSNPAPDSPWQKRQKVS